MFPKRESSHGSQPARLPSLALLLKACLPFMVRLYISHAAASAFVFIPSVYNVLTEGPVL